MLSGRTGATGISLAASSAGTVTGDSTIGSDTLKSIEAVRGTNFADSLVNSALRYRAQAPLIDSLLKEIGLSGGGDLGKLDNLMREPVTSDETLK